MFTPCTVNSLVITSWDHRENEYMMQLFLKKTIFFINKDHSPKSRENLLFGIEYLL